MPRIELRKENYQTKLKNSWSLKKTVIQKKNELDNKTTNYEHGENYKIGKNRRRNTNEFVEGAQRNCIYRHTYMHTRFWECFLIQRKIPYQKDHKGFTVRIGENDK